MTDGDTKRRKETTLDHFMECASCAAKPGTPTLCKACLHNRALVDYYRQRSIKQQEDVELLRDAARAGQRATERYNQVKRLESLLGAKGKRRAMDGERLLMLAERILGRRH